MGYCKDLDMNEFDDPKEYMLERVKRGLNEGYDLENIAEHYKQDVDKKATNILKKAEEDKLKVAIQKDLDNLAVIDKTNVIVYPLELVGRVYMSADKNKYFDEILEKRLERRRKVNKLRESVLQKDLDKITQGMQSILTEDKKEEAFANQFR